MRGKFKHHGIYFWVDESNFDASSTLIKVSSESQHLRPPVIPTPTQKSHRKESHKRISEPQFENSPCNAHSIFNFYDGMCLAGSVFIGLRSVIIAIPRLRRELRNYFLSNFKFLFLALSFLRAQGVCRIWRV